MRVMLSNPEGRHEVVLVDKASLAVAGHQIILTRSDSHECIYVDVNNWTAHTILLNLLENGYVDLSKYAADYKKL